jgi:hypothetical protein
MLEIILISRFCRKLGEKLRAKGHSAGGYQAMFVVMWFAGEIIGGLVGFFIAMLLVESRRDEPNLLLVYGFAIAGAAFGGFIPFWIAGQLPDHNEHQRLLAEQPYYSPGGDAAPQSDAFRGIPDDRLQR